MGNPVSQPRHLEGEWFGYNFLLGVGTGLGSALIVDGVLEPMELVSSDVQEETHV